MDCAESLPGSQAQISVLFTQNAIKEKAERRSGLERHGWNHYNCKSTIDPVSTPASVRDGSQKQVPVKNQ